MVSQASSFHSVNFFVGIMWMKRKKTFAGQEMK